MSDDPQHAPDPDEAQRRLAQAFLDDLAAAEAEAPSFEEVAAYVEGRLQGDARALFEERLASDELLRAEVDDLRALRSEMAAARRAAPEWTRWAAAAAVVAGVGGGWLWLRERPVPGDAKTAHTQSPAGGAPAAASPATLTRIADATGPIALRADGTVDGVPAALQARVADALRSGALPVAALRKDLAVSAVTPMGAGGGGAAFGPIAPLSSGVLSDRPTLQWSAHPSARAYVVSVYDLDLEPIATSPRLTKTEWTPERPLPRGRTYLWQIEAVTSEGRVTAPAPPAAEARFHVAAESMERDTRAALDSAGGSHLASALVLAERGFRDDAARELGALAALNPDSPEVQRLRASLTKVRP